MKTTVEERAAWNRQLPVDSEKMCSAFFRLVDDFEEQRRNLSEAKRLLDAAVPAPDAFDTGASGWYEWLEARDALVKHISDYGFSEETLRPCC